MAASTIATLSVLLAVAAGCIFTPAIEQYGYPTCDAPSDCPAGTSCQGGQCYSPPWYDEDYISRQHLSVENKSAGPLAAGTAVPVIIGAGGLLEPGELGAEGLFVRYDEDAFNSDEPESGWSEVPVFRDVENDRLTAWLALPDAVEKDETGTLAFIVTGTPTEEATLADRPLDVFDFYDAFDLMTVLDNALYEDVGSAPITVAPNVMTLGDRAQLIVREPLTQPSSFYITGRVNGTNCDALFIGAIGDDRVGSAPPYVGFFFGQDLLVAADVAPTAMSAPAFLSDPVAIDTPTAAHVYGIHLGGGQVRLTIDGEVFDEELDLRPPLEDVPMYMTIDVDGDNCSFEATTFWKVDRPLGDLTVDKGDAFRYGAY